MYGFSESLIKMSSILIRSIIHFRRTFLLSLSLLQLIDTIIIKNKQMKNLDLLTKRILLVTLGVGLSVSMILCSASLFVYSIKTANAAPVPANTVALKVMPQGIEEYPMGIANGYAYYMEYANNGWFFNKHALSDFK
jgi:hypothetical protein